MSERLKLDLDLIVLNCTLATVQDVVQCDIGVKDEKVHSIVPQGSLAGLKAKKTLMQREHWLRLVSFPPLSRVNYRHVLTFPKPGGIDAHVHLQEPPLFGLGSTADSFESGTRAAIAGGTTTIVALTNVPTANATATTPFREMGISSVKIYMTYEALHLNDEQFLDVLFQSRLNKVTTLVHAENDSMIAWMTKELHERQLYAPKYHTASHPSIAEIEASYRAICLAEFIDTPILIVHVSNPRAVDNIRQAQAKGLPIYAETCPQYLFLSSENLDRPGLEGAKYV
ncbi:hypothetical protein N7519_010034 [Penicillium mononematosum]|uniref:uncharacterized protein n=1 Tax=Penicillium mononematosum TaxID=268346 RepID=UPI0025482A32|nr:uncharacterized protein N7519_010034 [Penicillium mononematosum]KAJ6179573.1 hypothetical protein N7519_010034 [Penicillium mononematosum]